MGEIFYHCLKFTHDGPVLFLCNLYKKDWYDEGAINCSVMVSLIDAEYMMPDSGGKYSMPPSIRIKKFYDDAIEVAEEQDLKHIEAFCFERASMRFEAAGSEELSAEYIANAHESYLEWNAIAKVDDVEEKHASKLQLAKQAEIKHVDSRRPDCGSAIVL